MQKAKIDPYNDPKVYRKDYAGAWIKFDDYGNTNSIYGWEADHVKPISNNGKDDVSNMLPLQWQNNESKGDNYPEWKTVISSNGNKKIDLDQSWYVNI